MRIVSFHIGPKKLVYMNIANESDVRKIKAGVLVNLAGGISIAGLKGFTMAMPAIFGVEGFAAYAVVYGLVEILSWGIFNGYGDACIYFQARGGDDSYKTLAAGLRQPVFITTIVAIVLWLLAPWLYQNLWPEQNHVLVDLLRLAMPSLPALALTYCLVEATRAKLDMRWAVLCIQFLFPALVLIVGVVLQLGWGLGVRAMGWGLLLSPWLCLPIALWGFSRHYSILAVLKESWPGMTDWEVANFALPQSVSMFVNQGLPRMDILLLSFWSTPQLVAVYGVIAELLLIIRLPKSMLFGVFAPLVADLSAHGETGNVQKVLDRFVMLSATCSFALLILTYVFRDHVLQMQGLALNVDISWSPVLAFVHLMVGALGLNGSLLLMHGHARTMMRIALIAIVVELGLGLLLVPSYGPWGAVIALGVSTAFLTMVQVILVDRKLHLDPTQGGGRFWLSAGIIWMCLVEWFDHGFASSFWQHIAQFVVGIVAMGLTVLFVRYWKRSNNSQPFALERFLFWWREFPRV